MPRWITAALVAAAASSCSSFGASPEEITDLCAIAADPASFNGKTIRVTGIAAPEPHYNIFLYSNECRRMAFIAGTTDKVDRTDHGQTLSNILWSTYPEQKRSATVDLVVKFAWHRDEVPARVMWVKEVASVQANPGIWQAD